MTNDSKVPTAGRVDKKEFLEHVRHVRHMFLGNGNYPEDMMTEMLEYAAKHRGPGVKHGGTMLCRGLASLSHLMSHNRRGINTDYFTILNLFACILTQGRGTELFTYEDVLKCLDNERATNVADGYAIEDQDLQGIMLAADVAQCRDIFQEYLKDTTYAEFRPTQIMAKNTEAISFIFKHLFSECETKAHDLYLVNCLIYFMSRFPKFYFDLRGSDEIEPEQKHEVKPVRKERPARQVKAPKESKPRAHKPTKPKFKAQPEEQFHPSNSDENIYYGTRGGATVITDERTAKLKNNPFEDIKL